MRIHPRHADVNPERPRAWATCDACGFIWNHHKLSWRMDWRGTRIQNLKQLVCPNCIDVPQRQLGALILPPDPVPIMNARPEQLSIDEQVYVIFGNIELREDGGIQLREDGGQELRE